MKEYNELIRGEMSPEWNKIGLKNVRKIERTIKIERLIDFVNQQIESGETPDENIYGLCIDFGYKNELKGENKMVMTNGKTRRARKSNLKAYLAIYVGMAKEREARGLTVDEICKLHNVSKSDYYNKLKQAREAGLGDEIPTCRFLRKSSVEMPVKESKDDVNLVSVGKFIIKIARGDTTITMPSDTSQDVITKFVRALRAC